MKNAEQQTIRYDTIRYYNQNRTEMFFFNYDEYDNFHHMNHKLTPSSFFFFFFFFDDA